MAPEYSPAELAAWITAMHLISEHADPMAVGRPWRENAEAHYSEHNGPGSIRSHSRNDFSFNEEKIEKVLEEVEEMDI